MLLGFTLILDLERRESNKFVETDFDSRFTILSASSVILYGIVTSLKGECKSAKSAKYASLLSVIAIDVSTIFRAVVVSGSCRSLFASKKFETQQVRQFRSSRNQVQFVSWKWRKFQICS